MSYVHKWFKDRDFPEIKRQEFGGPNEILAVVHARPDLDRLIKEHNGALDELYQEILNRDGIIKRLKTELALYRLGDKECRNEENI